MKNIRIETIADMIQVGMITADIGTDHAYLPILLVQSKKCDKVYACDIAQGPLSTAKENIQEAGYTEQIQIILSDGLKNVPADTECIVCAGMGYHTVIHILEDAMERLSSFQKIIIEVNRETEKMRQWISDHHYTITDERCVYEKGHDYICIACNTDTHVPYTKEEILYGTECLRKDTASYQVYISHRLEKIEQIFSKAKGNPNRKKELLEEKEFLSGQLKSA